MSNIAVEQVSSFDLSRAITFSKFFSKIKLSPSTKLVLRALCDHWNPEKGLMYPGQNFLAEATGASKRSVINSIFRLREKGIILTKRTKFGLNYYFTKKFFELLELSNNKTTKNFRRANSALRKRKNCTSKSANFAHPYIEQKKRTNKQQSKFKK